MKTTDLITIKNNHVVSCKLTSPELQQRKQTVLAELRQQVLSKKELPNGFAYQFPGTDEMIDSLFTFIKSERQCCEFFDFKVSVNSDNSVWLELSGPEGAKEFITAELML
jgi:hypothetical protein